MKYKLSMYAVVIKQTKGFVIIYNTLNGAIIKLEETIYIQLKKGNTDEVPFLDSLINEKIIVPIDMQEYEMLKLREVMAKTSFKTNELSFVVAPTLACNLRCVYCFEKGKNSNYMMTKDTANALIAYIVRQVENNKNISKVKITWFGGEPLLAFDIVSYISTELITKLSSLNKQYVCRMISNGVLFSQKNIARLVDSCNLEEVQITLDGLEEQYCAKKKTNSKNYEKVINNIVQVAQKANVIVRLNADKTNINDMYKLADLLYGDKLLVGKISLYFAHLKNYLKDENSNCFTLLEYIEEKEKFKQYLYRKNYVVEEKQSATPCFKELHCSLACKNNYAIGPYGELYKCEHSFGKKQDIVGDIVYGIYYNSKYFDEIKGIQNSHCEKCSLYPVCRANCPEVNGLVEFDEDRCSRFSDVFTRLQQITEQYIKTNSNT